MDSDRDPAAPARRYSLSSEKVRALGWEPKVYFADGLRDTVEWYRENRAWWEPLKTRAGL